ncbi:nitroreductase family protein [Marixanthomonas ophiurae]|uniref:Putative NAD(P)H nitroreductase n=1 Tax=Marixanthomonas ophiurae TaxID=387659 RepID=A0A3E1QBF6_9FLAO|nr:nitroreductase [Marixanthomonas ophiurae]RFN59472.1 nitroreductase [Marixanthomonas ophiurae]
MISEIIKSRRSVFPIQYNNQPISKEEIQTILQSANWAPTHRKTEPWRFKIFHSETARKQLAEFLGKTYKEIVESPSEFKQKKIEEKPMQSACVIAICMQRDPKESVPEWEEVAATAMAVQNMWLTAHDLKIGAYWSSPALKDHIHKLVDFNEGERCLGFFFMGKYDENLPEGVRKTSVEEKTTWF